MAVLAGADPRISKVEFSLVPPPVKDVGECLTDVGESPPMLYQDWGTIFRVDMTPTKGHECSNIEQVGTRSGVTNDIPHVGMG